MLSLSLSSAAATDYFLNFWKVAPVILPFLKDFNTSGGINLYFNVKSTKRYDQNVLDDKFIIIFYKK
jgi:hypothetical protein